MQHFVDIAGTKHHARDSKFLGFFFQAAKTQSFCLKPKDEKAYI
jgi:hypothetical protein